MKREELEGARKLFFTLLWVDIVATAIIGLNAFITVGTLQDIHAGRRTVDQSLISSFSFWDNLAKLTILTLIGVGIGLVKWLNACYRFSKESIGASGFTNDGWRTWASWVIPLVNLYMPYQIISEIYRAGSERYTVADDWKKESGSGALLAWWIFWLIAHFIIGIMFNMIVSAISGGGASISRAMMASQAQGWICVVSLVVAGLWFWVANLLTQRLLARNAVSANSRLPQYGYQAPATVTRPVQSAPAPVSMPTAPAPAIVTMSANPSPAQPVDAKTPSPFDEDAVYEVVANEMDSGRMDKGLWTRLFAELDGDEKKIKVAYIKQRAEKLMVAERVRIEQRKREETEQLHQAEEEQLRQMTIKERIQKNLVVPEEAAKLAEGFSTQFLLMCQRGTENQVEEMLKQRPVLVAVTNNEGYTGLHIAVQEGREQMVKLLIEQGSNPDAQNQYGLTPYALAMRKSAENISEYPTYRRIADLVKPAIRP